MENKVIRREDLGGIVSIDNFEVPIEVFERILKSFKEKGATHIELSTDVDYYSNSTNAFEFTPSKIFYESDYEKETRLKKGAEDKERKDKEHREKLETFEKEQLRKLKEKYEK